MKRRILTVFLALLFVMSLSVTVFAETEEKEKAEEAAVLDEAELLSEDEAEDLEERLQELSQEYDTQIVVATINKMEDDDIESYIVSYFNELELGYGEDEDGILLLVSMEPRKYSIYAKGLADEAIDSDSLEGIIDTIGSDLSDGNYADAFESFADECQYYLDGHINGFPFDVSGNLMMALIIGIVISLIVVLILKGQLKSVRKQDQANVYVKSGSMKVTVRSDLFLYRTVNRTKRQSNSSSGSSSSGKVASGSF